MVHMVPSIRQDFIAIQLRLQINRLHRILENIEHSEGMDCEFINESLKGVEIGLRYIRKVCSEN